MRWIFLSIFSLFFPLLCRSQVLLNEVFYDPAGSDEGFEFIEIVNLAESRLSLAGYAIEFHDGASENWVTIWNAASLDSIAGAGLFVVGGGSVVPPVDAIDDLSLQNGPDAVRLTRAGLVMDLVGYGALDSAAFYEGGPAPDVTSGLSLSRRPDGKDTGNNAADFEASEPSPGRFNVPRRDVALQPGPETPRAVARDRAGAETFVFWVVNAGTGPVEPGAVSVALTDSCGAGSPSDVRAIVPDGLAAGDSARVELAVDLGLGDHRIRSLSEYAGDENPKNDVVDLRRRVGSSPLLVSEIMSDPRDGCPEYVELYNCGPVPYELSGHFIRDCAHGGALISAADAPVPPGGFVVLTGDSAALVACFADLPREAVVQIEGSWPSLNQTGTHDLADSIVVLDPSLLPVERVGYPPQPADTGGRSLERVDLFPSFGRHTWVLSGAVSGGSPGRRSALSRASPPEGAGVAASPNPFDPYRSEVLIVTVPARPGGGRVVLDVFDIAGKRIAELGAATVLPTTFVWDGRDSGGRTVLPGLYILSCEITSGDRGSRLVEKVVVGCGRRKNGTPRE